MNNCHPSSSGFVHNSVQSLQYSYMPQEPLNSTNSIPSTTNGQHVYHNGFEDIPDIDAYERNLRIDLPTYSLASMSNVPQAIPTHMPSQITPHSQPHIPQFQPLLPPSQLQPQSQPRHDLRIQPMDHTLSKPTESSFVPPPRSQISQCNTQDADFTNLVGKLETKNQETVKNRQMPMKFITPKLEVIDDQTPLMSPVSTSTKMHRNGLKLEMQITVDPEGLDDDPEDGKNYPEPDLFDIKATTMTEYELDVLRQNRFGLENSKKMEVPDASAPPNKIVEFLMYNRTLKESELMQLNGYRTKRNRLSLNHVKNNSDREFDQKACESLVKKLKDKKHDLQNLLDVVHTKGKKYTGCITIPRTLDGRLQVHGRKGFPHVVYGKLWRFSEMTKNETRHLDHCKHAFEMKSDLVCVNPYHYEIVTGQMVVGQRENHENKEINNSHVPPRYSGASVARVHSMDDPSSRFNTVPLRPPQVPPSIPTSQMYPPPNVSYSQHNGMPQMPSHGVPRSYAAIPPQYLQPQQGYDPSTSSVNVIQEHYTPPLHDPQYPLGFSPYSHPYSNQQPGPSNCRPQYNNSAHLWNQPPNNIPSTSSTTFQSYPVPSTFTNRAVLDGNHMQSSLYNLNTHQWQPRPRPVQKRTSQIDLRPKQRTLQEKLVSLSDFRDFCFDEFGNDFFNSDERKTGKLREPEVIHEDKFQKTKDPDILCVEMFKRRLKIGEDIKFPFPVGAPYEDVCKFVSSLGSEGLIMTGEEPKTVNDDTIWGTVIYYEHNQTIGERKCTRGEFHIDGGFIPSNNRYSLGFEENTTRSDAAFKVRAAIIEGIRFSYKEDGSVWIQNNMSLPVFVTSGYLDEQSGGMQSNKVHKIYGHGKMKVFGFEHCRKIIRDRALSRQLARQYLRGVPNAELMNSAYRTKLPMEIQNEANRSQDSLVKYCCVKVSLCKGFGPAYPERMDIKECPVWLELKINSAYNFMDDVVGILTYKYNGEFTEEELRRIGFPMD